MASRGGFSYKPNVSRNVTKKWREASQARYDDWEEEEEEDDDDGQPAPVSADNPRHPAWSSNRSATNPSPSRSTGRPSSFDRSDEQRHFSGGAGFDSAYPTTQRSPFPEPDYDLDHPQPRFYGQPALSLNTQTQGPYPQPAFRPTARPMSRGQQHPYPDAPFSAPGAYPHSRSGSGNRPSPGGMIHRQESPIRPDSRASSQSARYFPPRKSSLSQQQPPPDIPIDSPYFSQPAQEDNPPTADPKPLPFIRPSEIYKRMEEEREKERRSQESSRPSIDLESTRPGTDDLAAEEEQPASKADDADYSRRLKPVLDTVPERKSEYGFENMLKAADADHPSLQVDPQQSEGVQRHATNASSVYTDRPDPVSASTMSRNVSLRDMPEPEQPASPQAYEYSLPPVSKTSTFDSDLTPAPTHPSANYTSHKQQEDQPEPASTSTVEPNVASQLDHKPSLGYRSVVQQAFDESQNRDPRSPASGAESLPRSNSQSTAEISPIISRSHERVHTPSPIPEEPTPSSARPMSDATVKGDSGEAYGPPQRVVHPEYRRDHTPPSRDNSPAQSVGFGRSIGPQPQQATMGSDDNEAGSWKARAEENADRARVSSPSQATTSAVPPDTNKELPQHPDRTASEEYEEWQAQRKQFRSQVGMQDSNPTTPSVTSPVSRAESPAKGSVRDIAEKLESQSGRSTPLTQVPGDQNLQAASRPAYQPRMESFRPSIPGGWQSYTASSGAGTPRLDPVQTQLRPGGQPRYESTESVPTAEAPQPREDHGIGVRDAFAAAAAAGSALAGSFLPGQLSTGDVSEEESENEWDRSSASSPVKDMSEDVGHDEASSHVPERTGFPQQRVANSSSREPASQHAAHNRPVRDGDRAFEPGASTQDYFPAPLRTSKLVESSGHTRPPVPAVHHDQEAEEHGNNEELQQEIVKSLTPRSSNVDVQPEGEEQETSTTPSPPQEAKEQGELYQAGPLQPSTTSKAYDSPALATKSREPSDAPRRPFLQQRFSWEVDNESPEPTPSTPRRDGSSPIGSPETVKPPLRSPVTRSFDSPRAPQSSGIPSPAHSRTQSKFEDPPTPVAKEFGSGPTTGAPFAASFRNIMNIANQQQRIQAFQDNTNIYTQSNGQLEQWILAQRGPEHEDVFKTNEQLGLMPSGVASAEQKPSPNRPVANASGSKIIQEDGKKLMAVAGRFGGKAGVAAKGLFARGKDKLRSASAGDKGFSTDRRKSTGASETTKHAPAKPSQQSSTFLSRAPQIPAQDLSSSLIDGDWSPDLGEKDRASIDNDTRSGRDVIQAPQVANDGHELETREMTGVQRSHAETDLSKDEPATWTRDLQLDPKQDEVSRMSDLPAKAPQPGINVELTEGPADDGSALRPSTPKSNEQDMDKKHRPLPVIVNPLSGSRTADGADLHPDKSLLGVGADKRHSMISDVSSASPDSRIGRQSQEAQRSISPAEPGQRTEEAVPSYDSAQQYFSKEEEAAREISTTGIAENDPVPGYTEAPHHGVSKQSVAPGTQIIPVADLKNQRRINQPTTRPFSFEASDLLQQQIAEQGGHAPNAASQPLSPVSQTMSKSMSGVSSEDMGEDAKAEAPRRQSKSYSRPFGAVGADPVGNHPAFRQAEYPIDRQQMYSSEAPLVGSRPQAGYTRPEEGRSTEGSEEEGYRIPGPYHQEYRSPRRTTMRSDEYFPPAERPTQPQPPVGEAPPTSSLGRSVPQTGAQKKPRAKAEEETLARKDEGRSKRNFGGIFGVKSKSKPVSNDAADVPKKARPGVFSRGSRHDSSTSQQSSHGESRDVLGQLPSSKQSTKRSSRDFRSPTPTSGSQRDGAKKRFSAMGNLFSKSRKTDQTVTPQRSTTLPSNSTQPTRDHSEPQQTYHGPVTQSPQQMKSRPQGAPPPPGGYYGPQQQQSWESVSNGWGANGTQQRYPYPQHSQSNEARPSDLRIDTSTSQPSSRGGPNTAPPQSRATRDISYTSRPYVPPSQRGSASRYDDHVVKLHKRARSPKLGRRSSDEDRLAADEQGRTLTPVGALGTFSNKKISPVGGVPRPEEDQEAPYRIALPGEEAEKRRTRQLMIEQQAIKDSQNRKSPAPDSGARARPTVAERLMNPQLRGADEYAPNAMRAPNSQGSKHPKPIQTSGFVAELPGSKAEGYESEEEPVMSATAFPGDWETMPVWVGDEKD